MNRNKKSIMPVIIAVIVFILVIGFLASGALLYKHFYIDRRSESAERSEGHDSEIENIEEIIKRYSIEESEKMMSEKEVFKMLLRQGIDKITVYTSYSEYGEEYSEPEKISDDSDEKHPVYEAQYETAEGQEGTINIVEDSVYFVLDKPDEGGSQIILSDDSDDIKIYDSVHNEFLVVKPSVSYEKKDFSSVFKPVHIIGSTSSTVRTTASKTETTTDTTTTATKENEAESSAEHNGDELSRLFELAASKYRNDPAPKYGDIGYSIFESVNGPRLLVDTGAEAFIYDPEGNETRIDDALLLLHYDGKYYDAFRHAYGVPGLFLNMYYPEEHHYKAEAEPYHGELTGEYLLDGSPITKEQFDPLYDEYKNNHEETLENFKSGIVTYYHDGKTDVYSLDEESPFNADDTNAAASHTQSEKGNWKDTYKNKLYQLIDENEIVNDKDVSRGWGSRWGLYDIDNDGVPELMFMQSSEKYSLWYIYSIYENKLVESEVTGNGKWLDVNSEVGATKTTIGVGYYLDINLFKNGKLEPLVSGDFTYDDFIETPYASLEWERYEGEYTFDKDVIESVLG